MWTTESISNPQRSIPGGAGILRGVKESRSRAEWRRDSVFPINFGVSSCSSKLGVLLNIKL